MSVKQTKGRDLTSAQVQALIMTALAYIADHAEYYGFFVKSKGSEMARFGLLHKGDTGVYITTKDTLAGAFQTGAWINCFNGEFNDSAKQTCHQIDRLRQACGAPVTILPLRHEPQKWEDFETLVMQALNDRHYLGLTWYRVGCLPNVRFDVVGKGFIAGREVTIRMEVKFDRGRV